MKSILLIFFSLFLFSCIDSLDDLELELNPADPTSGLPLVVIDSCFYEKDPNCVYVRVTCHFHVVWENINDPKSFKGMKIIRNQGVFPGTMAVDRTFFVDGKSLNCNREYKYEIAMYDDNSLISKKSEPVFVFIP